MLQILFEYQILATRTVAVHDSYNYHHSYDQYVDQNLSRTVSFKICMYIREEVKVRTQLLNRLCFLSNTT